MQVNLSYLGMSMEELAAKGGLHTAAEISQQPEIWEKVWQEVKLLQPTIEKFLAQALPKVKRIILTGAGTSAFIGEALRGAFQRETGIATEAIASTDIVTHPENYLIANEPVLIVSFARSGNSPESAAVLQLADSLCKSCYHLIITCNSEGGLALHPSTGNKVVLVLPPEANDASLVMTSSFTGMLLSGLLIARIRCLDQMEAHVRALAGMARRFLKERVNEMQTLAAMPFNRAVFLGSGSLRGIATEAALKIQELTDGLVVCQQDSYLGFRHGPRSVVDEQTLMVYLLSSANPYACQYEKDLIETRHHGTQALAHLGIAGANNCKITLGQIFSFSEGQELSDDELIALCYIVPVQVLGFFKSLLLGLRPDQPSANNDISRVVEGVKIYRRT